MRSAAGRAGSKSRGHDRDYNLFHQVLISAFSRFSGREPGCRVSDEDVAQSFSDPELRKALLYAIGDVEHLFIAPSGRCNCRRRHA